ncbi:MAG: vWA domain-containing protein [Planctomyces sp.]
MVSLTDQQQLWCLLSGLAALLLAGLAEWLHARRVRRVAILAFGPARRPARWATGAGPLRCLAAAGLVWALLVLFWLPPNRRTPGQDRPVPFEKLKHVILVLDVSPSMRLRDAGTTSDQSRMVRAREVMESWFRRIPMNEYRVSILATYTKALPVVEDTRDIAVVENVLNDLPMHFAFQAGETNLFSGLEAAAEMARGWRPRSTTIVLVSDGDTVPATGMPAMPAAVADVVVVGIGDPVNGTFLNGRNSKQDVSTLRQIAARLRGFYHNGNDKHLPSELLRRLTLSAEGAERLDWGWREWAQLILLLSASILAGLPILLNFCGTRWLPGIRKHSVPANPSMDKPAPVRQTA